MALDHRRFQFFKTDVFTDTPFCGNPLAVVPESSQFTDRELQQIAREMNLSETVFVFPPSDPDTAVAKLRIFTPTHEIPFAGHPVLGTFYVLGQSGLFPLQEPVTKVRYECNLGTFSVELLVLRGKIDRIIMDQPAPQFLGAIEDIQDIYDLRKALGLPKDAIMDKTFPIEIASTGLPVIIVPIRTLTAVKSISLDLPAIHDLCERLGASGLMAFSTMTVEDLSTVHARMFAPSIGIGEDPATGSAGGALGGYLVKNGVIEVRPMTEVIVEQGYEIDRPSRVLVHVLSDDDMIQGIKVGGQVVLVAEGHMIY